MRKIFNQQFFVCITVFLCGMATMILELAGVRVISPFLGSTHIIYTCIIGIIMASLSLGYFLGGKLSNQNPSFFKLSFFVFSCAVYVFIIAFCQFEFLRFLLKLDFSFILKSLIASILLFSIPSFLLGIVTPYITQLVLNDIPTEQKNKKEGSVIGKIYAISTIGSIIGTFLCGFYLIIYFGIDTIFFALAFELFFCALILIFMHIYKKKLNFFKDKILFFFLILIYFSMLVASSVPLLFYRNNNKITVFPTSIYSKTTPYNYISVVEFYVFGSKNKPNKLIGLSNQFSLQYQNDSTSDYAFPYIKMFHNFFINKKIKNNNLFLGNAVGVFLSGLIQYCNINNINNISFDVVEIDKYFTEIGIKYFNMPANDKRIHFFYEDARTFLNKNIQKKYDTIFYDIFVSDTFIIPYYLITKQVYEQIYNAMNDNAIFVMNVIGQIKTNSKKSMYLRQIYTQVKSVFNDTKIYKTQKNNYTNGNFLIVGYKNPNDPNTIEIQEKFKKLELHDIKQTDEVYTDKFCPIEKFS